MARWNEVEDYLVALATVDLRAEGRVRPTLVAFEGDALLFSAGLRPHERGEYRDPLIELLSLAVPLAADRVAYLCGGRAWSFADPIPPVLDDDHDLRQHVVMIVEVDGHARRQPATRSKILPYTLEAGALGWGERLETDEGEGWIPRAIACLLTEGNGFTGSDVEIGNQALRCIGLGHELGIPDPRHGSVRLAEVMAAALEVRAS